MLVGLTSLGVIGCVSIIDFDTSDQAEQLVIYGKLTNSQNYHQGISVKRSSLETTVGRSITDAVVTVIDETGQEYPYQFSEEFDQYIPIAPFIGIPGTSYQARISIGEQTYESSAQRMPVYGSTDTAYFRFDIDTLISDGGIEFEQYRLKILTDSQFDQTDDTLYLKWDVEQITILSEVVLPVAKFPNYSPNVCYLFEGFINEKLLLYNGDEIRIPSIQEQELAFIPLDRTFINRRGYGIFQSSITRESMEYYQKVDQIANRVGSIFEVPPAPVPGNFRNINDPENPPLGFFEVAKMDTTGTYVLQGDLPVRIGRGIEVPNCDYPITLFENIPAGCLQCVYDIGVPTYCTNCTLLPNSTRERPSYLF